MQTLFICEKNENISSSYVVKLCSNFPVRQFTCVDQVNSYLAKHSKKGFRRSPKANLLVDLDTLNMTLSQYRHSMSHSKYIRTSLILTSHDSDINEIGLRSLEKISSNLFIAPRMDHIEQLKSTIDYLMYSENDRNLTEIEAIKYKNIEFSYDSLEIKFFPDRQIESLPLKEAKILQTFLERPGQVISRGELIERVWGLAHVSPRSLDCHISRLRKKISDSGLVIASEYGGGYCFD